MKKIMIIITCLLALLLASCASTPVEKAQDRIVEIGEQYLNYEISREAALEALNEIEDLIPEDQLGLQIDLESLQIKISSRKGYEAIAAKVQYIKDYNY